mmetsp:Transcript_49311/g.96743  ORF Transcript_49311/g.96743 Transcript_49311/m.96743 type:complete len:115 (+) Transcript_49311:1604-1948(+)
MRCSLVLHFTRHCKVHLTSFPCSSQTSRANESIGPQCNVHFLLKLLTKFSYKKVTKVTKNLVIFHHVTTNLNAVANIMNAQSCHHHFNTQIKLHVPIINSINVVSPKFKFIFSF